MAMYKPGETHRKCCCAREQKEIEAETKNPDGTLKLRNPYLKFLNQDVLYHFALGSETHDLRTMFKDVKFVIMSETERNMLKFAHYIENEIGLKLPTGVSLKNIAQYSNRFSIYKVGPVLCVSHGVGSSSVSAVLNEVIKLMSHAKVKEPIFLRIGASCGIGVETGTLVITEGVVDGLMRPFLELPILGQMVRRSASLDKRLVKDLLSQINPNDDYETISGKTMSNDDFYEGQGRMDGAFCEFNECQRLQYLKFVQLNGVLNVDMDSMSFAAITHHAGIRSAIITRIRLDWLNCDQVHAPEGKAISPQQLNNPFDFLHTTGRRPSPIFFVFDH